MSVRLYHQVGHFSNWNLEAFVKDKCGDGLILSPVHQSMSKVCALDPYIRSSSLFDPQFYLPNSPKAKLSTYQFFPEQISGGFSTREFHLVALESAKACVAFQKEQMFQALIIPARFIDQLVSKYFERQEEYTVLPFLKVASDMQVREPIYLTLPLTSAMLEDEGFRVQLLNWATSFPEVSGVYVLLNDERRTKQINSVDLLIAYMDFIHQLKTAGLRVIAGHLNCESLLFSVVDDVTVTFGSFENTRIFSLDKFLESDDERRAPKSRIYLPALLNWIQFDQAMQIRSADRELWDRIYYPTEYAEAVIGRPVDPYFNQPDLYKHHFVCMHEQIVGFNRLSIQERYQRLRGLLINAMALHEEIAQIPVDLDLHGRGTHLQSFLDALNSYYRAHIS